MLPINQYITVRNRTVSNRTNIQYLAIHYVGAVSSAKANCSYFYSEYRGASAHYFVDDTSIWQCVLDKDIAWHVGANSYRHPYCRNSNSIGIEMCCFNNNGTLDMSEAVINNTIELAAYICKKYGITIDRVVRHYDVTGKSCPAPFVNNSARWEDFKARLNAAINGGSITPAKPEEHNTMNKTMFVNVNSSLNIRSGAGTGYSIVGSLKNGQQVTVYEMSNNFARIGNEQWVCATYLKEGAVAPVITTKTKYVNVESSLNIRIGAGTGYRIVGSLTKGNKVTVYEEVNGWSRIGDAQWVSSQYLVDNAPVQPKTMYVTASALNVRKGAGTGYAVVTCLTKGAQVTVYEESNGWGKIGDGKWVSMNYLSGNTVANSYPTKYVTAASGLNVRSGAGTGYKIVKCLLKGTKVTVYETKGNWSRIGNGQWVCSSYIK